MRSSVFVLAAALLSLALAAPAPAPAPQPDPADDSKPEIIEIIAPAASAQETLSSLNLGAPGSELSERNKRTIGILRQLFPQLTQIIEQKVQQITSFVLKTFGPVFLKAFLGNNNNGRNSGGGGGTVELDDDDDDDDEDIVATAEATTIAAITNAKAEASDLEETVAATTAAASDAEESVADTTVAPADEAKRRKRSLYFTRGAAGEDNQLLSGAESQQAEVRVAFADGAAPAAADDQQTAAQNTNLDEISLDDADDTEENRNKRFLSFGGNSAGGSGGGSGNFLFDIVRLVAGSSSGSSSEGVAAEGEDGAAKGDNLTEGVPGPITRLFIIANRGIANLIQDLILRIAQTSERIVNFKARLITSII